MSVHQPSFHVLIAYPGLHRPTSVYPPTIIIHFVHVLKREEFIKHLFVFVFVACTTVAGVKAIPASQSGGIAFGTGSSGWSYGILCLIYTMEYPVSLVIQLCKPQASSQKLISRGRSVLGIMASIRGQSAT